MEVKLTTPCYPDRTMIISEFVREKLERVYDCSGAIEGVQSQANNNSKAIGNLIQILMEKGILSGEDLFSIVEQYNGGGYKAEVVESPVIEEGITE